MSSGDADERNWDILELNLGMKRFIEPSVTYSYSRVSLEANAISFHVLWMGDKYTTGFYAIDLQFVFHDTSMQVS